jgi:hypothetical protein
MNWQEIFTIIGSIGAIIGGGLAWMWTRIDKKFDHVDKRFEQMDKKFEQKFEQIDKKFEQRFEQIDKKFEQRFDQVDKKFEQVNTQLTTLNVQIAKLETRVEERTLRVIHVEKTGTEEKKIAHTFTVPQKNED